MKPRIASPDIDRRAIAVMREGMDDFLWSDAHPYTLEDERRYEDALRGTTEYAVRSLSFAMHDVADAFIAQLRTDGLSALSTAMRLYRARAMKRPCRYCTRPRVKGSVACRLHAHLLTDTRVMRRVRRLAR